MPKSPPLPNSTPIPGLQGIASIASPMTDQIKSGGGEAIYVICKYGGYYRPNAAGYTNDVTQAGRYTLAEAISHSHPNGPDGPRDGITYHLAPEVSAPAKAGEDGDHIADAGEMVREALRPMSDAPKDRSYVLAQFHQPDPEFHSHAWHGRTFVIRHEGYTDQSGYDMGWSLFPGYGGCPDQMFAGWLPLPAALHGDQEG